MSVIIKDNARPTQLLNNTGTVCAITFTLTATSTMSKETDTGNAEPVRERLYANTLSEDEVDFLVGSAARSQPIEGTLEDLERSFNL